MDINQILGFVIIVLSALNIRRMLRAREGEQNKGYLFLNSKAIVVNALFGGINWANTYNEGFRIALTLEGMTIIFTVFIIFDPFQLFN